MHPSPQDASEIPSLLRAARGAYGNAIAEMLAAAGFDDLPQNGHFVLAGMARHGASAVEMTKGLGVSRQSASHLIDTLVVRGYLERRVNDEDSRRLDLELTERGRSVAASVRAAVEQVDRELHDVLSDEQLAGLRAGLAALAALKEKTDGPHSHAS